MILWYFLWTTSAGALWGMALLVHKGLRGRAASVLEVLLSMAGSITALVSVLATLAVPESVGAAWWLGLPAALGQYTVMVAAYRRVESVIP